MIGESSLVVPNESILHSLENFGKLELSKSINGFSTCKEGAGHYDYGVQNVEVK